MFSSLDLLDTTDDVLVAYFFQGNNLCKAAHHVVTLVSALNFSCLCSIDCCLSRLLVWFKRSCLALMVTIYDFVERPLYHLTGYDQSKAPNFAVPLWGFVCWLIKSRSQKHSLSHPRVTWNSGVGSNFKAFYKVRREQVWNSTWNREAARAKRFIFLLQKCFYDKRFVFWPFDILHQGSQSSTLVHRGGRGFGLPNIGIPRDTLTIH